MTKTRTQAPAATTLAQIALVALIGLTVLFTAGLSQSQTLHDAAHDTRHSTGFPCH